MIKVEIVDQGVIDTSLPAKSDPQYQMAALALFLRQQFADLRAGGMTFTRPELTDLTDFNNDMSTFLSEANERYDDFLQGLTPTVAAVIPDVLAIGAAYVSGGATEVVGLILQRVLGQMHHREDSRAEHEGAQEMDTQAVVDKLEEVREAIMQVLNEFNINLYNDVEGASWSVGPLEE